MALEKIGVVGCGLMGSGIARVCGAAGYKTVVREVNQNLLEEGMDKIKGSLTRDVNKEHIGEDDLEETLSNLHGTTELSDLADCDLIIEAVVEDVAIKEELFTELDGICKQETIFTSNTSSLTITELASATSRQSQFAGLHFFNPAYRMQLVEVIKSLETNDGTYQQCMKFVESLGKKPITCRDTSGYVVNRLLVPYMLDAVRALEEGVGSIADIDRGMQLGAGHPIGPFVLLDFVGLDTTYKIANIMFEEFREKRYAPPPLLKKMVRAGFLGKKSRQGFYDYSGDHPVPSNLNF